MTQPDTLIDSYRAAQKLQDDAGPSELTRQRILAHAEQLANNKPNQDSIIPSENTTDLIATEAINTPAANDSHWKIRALASIAVFGIAGLLMLQLRKEAPEAFVPTAKPPVVAERAAELVAISERESKSAADKSVQAPVQATPAPAPASVSAPAAVADSAKLARSAPMAPRATAQVTTNSNARLFNAIQSKDATTLKLALDNGEDKNAKNAAVTPALSVCVQSEQLNLVRLLVAAGADVNALDARGLSPLAHARKLVFTDIVSLLLKSGAK